MFTTEVLVDRIRSEYVALPGLKLTRDQACRLWAVDDEHCTAAFEILLAEGFLHRTGTGKFVALPRPSAAFVSATAVPKAETSPIRCPHCRKLNTIQQEEGGYLSTTFRCAACHRILSITQLSA
jgi:hypothetical protein